MSGPSYHGWTHAADGTDPLPQATLTETGWTVVFGDGFTPVVTGLYQAIWEVPRTIVGDGTYNWYVFDPSARVATPSTSVDVEIMLYRVRNASVSNITDDPIVIDAGTYSSRDSASPCAIHAYRDLRDEDGSPAKYDAIMIGVDVAGDAEGLSVTVPIGIERPVGSGVH